MGNTDEFITTAEKEAHKEKALKIFKIAIFLAFVLAAVGIGFGVYGVIEVVQKNNQIAELKEQINNDHGVYPASNAGNVSDTQEELDAIDINTGQEIALYYFASIAEDGEDRYSLMISKTSDNLGFFNIMRTSAIDQEIGHGHIEYDGENMTLMVGPYVGYNNFTAETNIATSMGFTFEESATAQPNYKVYTFKFDKDETTIELGKTELIRLE